jgi:hypothetical protein
MPAGTMVELVAARNTIDTTDQLTMAEAFQKCFIANGAKLKIVDFVNVKLTHSEVAVPNAFGDIITQTQSPGNTANMVVDYVSADLLTTYGFAYYTGSATTFVNTTNVTGGTGSDFGPTAVTASPHWRDWAVYPETTGGITYGSMPTKAYLVCRYRNRVVLSGNPEEPYQWYMCRSGQPYDWLYAANDAGSPVRGGNADAGILGDIVKALIPNKDDYLVFGCAGSMWVLFGDPAEGGQLRSLDRTTGIFGATSWCWGEDGQLYFWGKDGIYRTTIPGSPVLISRVRLPRLVKDENASNSTHRITMAYDPAHSGILITVTKLDTGANSNYFYSFSASDGEQNIGGFFPETYPAACGVYSAINYETGDKTLDGLLIGSADGYIRRFDDDQKSDDGGAANVAINSYADFGPFSLGDGQRKEGILETVDLTVATGIASTAADSDDVKYKIFAGRTGSDAIKTAKANTAPRVAGTFKGPGNFRGSSRRQQVRGLFGIIRLENTTLAESWAFESLNIGGSLSGKAK